jgi:hypothetical protein
MAAMVDSAIAITVLPPSGCPGCFDRHFHLESSALVARPAAKSARLQHHPSNRNTLRAALASGLAIVPPALT